MTGRGRFVKKLQPRSSFLNDCNDWVRVPETFLGSQAFRRNPGPLHVTFGNQTLPHESSPTALIGSCRIGKTSIRGYQRSTSYAEGQESSQGKDHSRELALGHQGLDRRKDHLTKKNTVKPPLFSRGGKRRNSSPVPKRRTTLAGPGKSLYLRQRKTLAKKEKKAWTGQKK